MHQPMNGNPVQVVVLAQPAGYMDKQIRYRNMRTGFARQLIGLGIAQLIIGVLCIIFQGIALGAWLNGLYSGLDFIGHGFWTGLMFLITGPFGIAGGAKRSRCMVIAFNVLSVLSACFAACLIGIAVPGAILYAYGYCYSVYHYYSTTTGRYNNYNYDSNAGYWECYAEGWRHTGVAMEAMMAILGLIEGIIAIWSSAVCCGIGACCCNCGSSCCCPSSPVQNQFLMTDQQFSGQQQFIIANQQQAGPNQQQIFALNPQQPVISVDPQQQMAQYNQQQPYSLPYSQQTIDGDYTALTHAENSKR